MTTDPSSQQYLPAADPKQSDHSGWYSSPGEHALVPAQYGFLDDLDKP
jgi:hypothetical protein